MSQIKTLADQLRHSIADQKMPGKKPPSPKSVPGDIPPILQEIISYSTAGHKSMVHIKLDAKTAKTLNHFKMATGVDHIKLVAFAVKQLFKTNPELITLIKNFIQNVDL